MAPLEYRRPLPSKQTKLTRYGGWIPANPAVWEAFFDDLLGNIDPCKDHVPAVQAFKDAVNADPELVDLFDQTFLQVSSSDCKRIKSFDELLCCMDQIVIAAPKFQANKDDCGNETTRGEPIGVPLYLLFDLLSNTSAGYDLFRKEKLNAPLRDLLNSWGDYLRGPGSNSTLNDTSEGWFGELGLETLESDGRGVFNETYECPDPSAVNRGFTSWDEFFTRKFLPCVRPVCRPDPPDLLVYNACESTVYRIQTDVQDHDQFWLKGQPYSIYDMLGRHDDDVAHSFIGGTVYQAFLSPYDYHRWHSPVDGVIKEVQLIEGTYYAALPDNGADPDDPDFQAGDPRGALIRSQSWLTVAATRALIYIEADDKRIGTVVFIGVGMAEVSTCDITVGPGKKVCVGDEIGMFHFGGSTHALIFGPNVELHFDEDVKVNTHIQVNKPLAAVGPVKR
ncbi:phosphatidylserine decarboxylase [Lentinula raphanica]|uniref:Phosphatidylserine decarboxylase n=1 Tax=Lentinula raphanica TaxID=153919 RepID=A0AA38P913_9AGAR|nr:phosphatidylserine decarboxylase [Lentinula raphanica]KAJ3838583.1 phosphatidylserine decarboxylase [Lentinula raphanica]KAJ3975283.1 phosphatidylserine decarboxylase [Lentinula raphanica]